MPLANIACEFNDSLHPLDLTLDDSIKIFFLHFRECKEVDRPSVSFCRVFGNEGSQRLIDIFG